MPEEQPQVPPFEEPKPPQDTPSAVELQRLAKQDEENTAPQSPEPPPPPPHEQQVDRFGEPQKIDPPSPEEDAPLHLPTLVSNEFGVGRPQAEREIRESTLTLDGESYDPPNMYIPVNEIKDKKLEIKGPSRTFIINYT